MKKFFSLLLGIITLCGFVYFWFGKCFDIVADPGSDVIGFWIIVFGVIALIIFLIRGKKEEDD